MAVIAFPVLPPELVCGRCGSRWPSSSVPVDCVVQCPACRALWEDRPVLNQLWAAVRAQPADAALRLTLANALAEEGYHDEARDQRREARRLAIPAKVQYLLDASITVRMHLEPYLAGEAELAPALAAALVDVHQNYHAQQRRYIELLETSANRTTTWRGARSIIQP